jgi:hypothetical protein
MGLAGEIHIVVKTALTSHEADVFETLDWLTDSELSHGPVVTHVDGAGSRSGNSLAAWRVKICSFRRTTDPAAEGNTLEVHADSLAGKLLTPGRVKIVRALCGWRQILHGSRCTLS